MATEIKAIQCPKCGSTEKTELRPDHFRCESCGTEYFLDNGSATTVRSPGIVDPRRPAQATAKGCGPAAIVVVILVVVIALALIMGGADFFLHGASGGTTTSP